MAINFPDSPTLNQQFTSGGTTWIWDGTAWDLYLGSNIVTSAELSSTLSSYALNTSPTIGGTATFTNKPVIPGYQDSLSGYPFLYENNKEITENYTITTDKNAMSCGPVTINNGITLTIPSGSVWCII